MFKKVLGSLLCFVVVTTLFLSCDSFAEKEVVILHTNDIHARAKDNKLGIGYARFCTYLKDVKSRSKNDPIVLDAGDVLHGDIMAIADRGKIIVDIMNAIGYTAMVPGNFDFNYGIERLIELSEIAEFKVLSANVKNLEGNTIFMPYTIEERAGVRIGIFGLCTPETVIKTNAKNVKGVKFEECIEVSQKMVAELKSKNVDMIVCLGHIGLDTSNVITSDVICSNVSGIDLFVDGHSHSELYGGKKVNDSYIVSAGQYLNNIGQVTLVFDDNNKLKDIKCELVNKQDILSLKEDEEILKLINDTEEMLGIKKLYEVVAHTEFRLNGYHGDIRTRSTNMTRMLSQAVYEYSNADVAILKSSIIFGSIEPGDIRRTDIIKALSFIYYLEMKEMTGSQIKDMLEEGVRYYPISNEKFAHVAGMTYKFNPKNPGGSRVISIKKDNKEIDMNKKYTVALVGFEDTDNYTSLDIEFEQKELNEIFIDYLKRNPVTQDIIVELTV